MSSERRKPVAPFYAVAVLWLVGGVTLPLWQSACVAVLAGASAVVFLGVSALCRSGQSIGGEAAPGPAPEASGETAPAGNPDLEKMLQEGRASIGEMKRLNDRIAAPGISADISRLEQVSEQIFRAVQDEPAKLPQIRRFMDYYLPTTLKLLRTYERMSGTGVSGENIDATLTQIETMIHRVAGAFGKQLDGLYGTEALDISSDIAAMESMLAREGLTEQELKADPGPDDGPDIRLEL